MDCKYKIFDDNQGAVNYQGELFKLIKDIAPPGTVNYCNVLKHPVLNKWAVPVVTSGFYWDSVRSFVVLGDLEYLTDDWYETEAEIDS